MDQAPNNAAAAMALAQMAKDFNVICVDLRTIKSEFPKFSNELMRQALGLSPNLRSLVERAEAAAKTTVDWQDLEKWIDTATKKMQDECELFFNHLQKLGIDASEHPLADLASLDSFIKRMAPEKVSFMQRSIGPNWKILMIEHPTAVESPKMRLNVEQFWTGLSKRAQDVMCHWNALRQIDLGAFQRIWTNLTPNVRRGWLKKHAPKLPDFPCAGIYAYLEGLEGRRPSRDPFMFSSLNIDDLSEGDNLPTLLALRKESHPSNFRTSDGHHVVLGSWSGVFPEIPLSGLVVFAVVGGHGEADLGAMPSRNEGEPQRAKPEASQDYAESDYGISYRQCAEKNDVSMASNTRELTPSIGFWQLHAQSFVYKILSEFSQGLLGDCETMSTDSPPSDSTSHGNKRISVLDRSVRLQFPAPPDRIELNHLVCIAEDSLDEAKSDLWSMRQDPELWLNRVRSTPASPHGKSLNLLRTAFSRVDMLEILKKHLEEASAKAPETEPAVPSGTNDVLTAMTSLYGVLSTLVDERLSRLQEVEWPSGKFNPILSRLFKMLATNDPAIRVMGLFEVVRTVDREINQNEQSASIPLGVSQALSDFSLLVACLQQTSKHYHQVSDVFQHELLARSLDEEWKNQVRPWSAIGDAVLDAMNKTPRINNILRPKDTDAATQHHQFWSTVETHMREASEADGTLLVVFGEIQRRAPLHKSPPAAADSSATPFNHDAPENPTATEVKRSKRRKAALNKGAKHWPEPPTAPFSPDSPPQVVLPRIKPEKNVSFWRALCGRYSETFRWTEFCNAMIGIGCSKTSHGGAAIRFEWENQSGQKFSIVFHKPHGDGNGEKITQKQAREWWLWRLQEKFTLVLDNT